MRKRAFEPMWLGAKLILGSFALAAANLWLASETGLSQLALNGATLGGIGLLALALAPASERDASHASSEASPTALART